MIRDKLSSFLWGRRGADASEAVVPPFRVRLERQEQLAFRDAPGAQSMVESLTLAGLVDAGYYRADLGAPGRIRGFADPARSLFAAVLETDRGGLWIELGGRYTDGRRFLLSTDRPSPFKRPDHLPASFQPGATVEDALSAFEARRPGGPLEPAGPAGFPDFFQGSWAEYADWNAVRGGPGEKELRASLGKEASVEAVGQLQSAWRRRVVDHLELMPREAFLAATSLDPAQAQKVRQLLVFVYDQMPAGMAARRFQELTGGSDGGEAGEGVGPSRGELAPGFEAAPSTRAAFRKLKAASPGTGESVLLGSLAGPPEADVYVPSEIASHLEGALPAPRSEPEETLPPDFFTNPGGELPRFEVPDLPFSREDPSGIHCMTGDMAPPPPPPTALPTPGPAKGEVDFELPWVRPPGMAESQAPPLNRANLFLLGARQVLATGEATREALVFLERLAGSLRIPKPEAETLARVALDEGRKARLPGPPSFEALELFRRACTLAGARPHLRPEERALLASLSASLGVSTMAPTATVRQRAVRVGVVPDDPTARG